jgi:chaperonin GroEL
VATEVELKEKNHRVEDALSATRAAIEEGIVPGGGVALPNTVSALAGVLDGHRAAQTGINILRRALEEPMRRLVENAGHDEAVVIQEVRRRQQGSGTRTWASMCSRRTTAI